MWSATMRVRSVAVPVMMYFRIRLKSVVRAKNECDTCSHLNFPPAREDSGKYAHRSNDAAPASISSFSGSALLKNDRLQKEAALALEFCCESCTHRRRCRRGYFSEALVGCFSYNSFLRVTDECILMFLRTLVTKLDAHPSCQFFESFVFHGVS